jgi:iron only hydrogenase large subunit-like protein
MEYLNFQEANCQNCYKCLRTCKVKAIQIVDKQAKIIPKLCVGCGECFAICPQNAKSVQTDIDNVKIAIANGEKLVVSLAPSFPSYDNMSNPLQFITGLKALGFTQVEETSIGAVNVSNQYRKDYNSDQQHVITSSCPTVNFEIAKYYNDKVKYLSKVVSPMMAHNKIIKSRDENVLTVFIGPCISKKEETKVCLTKNSCIDYVITFDDIREWFNEENIDLSTLKPTAFDLESPSKTRWYPLSGGVEKASLSEVSENY